jgi:hypothetical protein
MQSTSDALQTPLVIEEFREQRSRVMAYDGDDF